MCSREFLLQHIDKTVLILSGDVPLISYKTMHNIVSNKQDVTIVTTEFENPNGYGRILCDNNKFIKIIEDKDCDIDQKNINIVNTGIYAISSYLLCKYLPKISNNNSQKEYYLTDIIEIINNNENININIILIEKEYQYEIIGVNTKSQLLELEQLYKIK